MSIVDQIREQMSRGDGIRAEDMEPLALAYSEEVSRLNQRLVSCSLLLRKGLRSEAIQQANMRPNLVEWASRLDFPELEDWFEILMFLELPVPKKLNREAVRQLHEALVDEQPLTELLRQHRRLAIAKAPLQWRLRVLRSIAKFDSMNMLWHEDIETWEKVRIAQIPRELATAQSSHSFQACKSLCDELKNSRWLNRPPKAIVDQAQSAADGLEYESQCVELKEIGQALYDSFCAQDESGGRQHRDHWNSLVQFMKQPPPLELINLVEPALLWLAESDSQMIAEESHQQAISELQKMLVHPKSIIDIQNAYQAVTRSGLEIPATLSMRVDSVLAELQLSNRRKSQLRIASVASLAVVLLVALAIWQWRHWRTTEIAKSVASIRQMLDDDRLLEAKQFLEQISLRQPYIVQAAEVQALVSDLDGRMLKRQQRIDEFETLVKELETVATEKIDLAVLGKAEKLAESESEKSRVFKLRRSYQEAEQRLEAEQLSAVRREVKRLTTDVDLLESSPIETLSHNSFDKVILELERIKRDFPRSGPTGQGMVDNLMKRARNLQSSVRDAMLTEKRRSDGLKRLFDASSLHSYYQALQYFVTSVAETNNKQEYAEALDEYQLWQTVDDWNLLCRKAGEYIDKQTPPFAQELTQSLSSFEAKVNINNAFPSLEGIKGYLERSQKRPLVLQELLRTIKASILSSILTLEVEIATIKVPGKVRLFAHANTAEKYFKEYSSSTIEVVSEANGAVRKVVIRGPISILKQPKQFINILANRIELRSDLIPASWDKEILDLISFVLKAEGLDGAVQEQVVVMLLDSGMNGSLFLNERLQKIFLKLKERQVPNEWLEPRPPQYSIEPDILREMKQVFSETYQYLANSAKDIEKLRDAKIQWVGCLYRDNKGIIVPWVSQKQLGTGKLLVALAHPTQTGKSELAVVAEVHEGKVDNLQGVASLLAGRPLFFISTP